MMPPRFAAPMQEWARLRTGGSSRVLCRLIVLAALLAGVTGWAHAAGLYEQQIVLQPGWNAVFLEVEPEPADVESAFAAVPVTSVWTWSPGSNTVDFIQNPNEGLDNSSGWLGYFPRPLPESVLTNLFYLQANRAYLIKLGGTQPVTWRVTGRPSLRSVKWVPDSFNLTGFFVDPVYPPTFGAYLAPAEALDGQPVYRLDATGVWIPVQQPYSEQIKSGEAYWVYCKGGSDYQGPVDLSLEYGTSLDFAGSLDELQLIALNNLEVDVDLGIRQLASATPVALALRGEDEDTGRKSWAELPTEYSISTTAGNQTLMRFGVYRGRLATDHGERVIAITNGLGYRRLVSVLADTAVPQAAPGFRKAVATAHAGLWYGLAVIDGVSQSQMGGSTPMPVGRSFPLRLIIHVNGDGSSHLLKEVIQMFEEGTVAPDAENPDYLRTETPGRYVLVTNEDLIPDFDGVALRDGEPVGLRLSTVAYDFPEETMEMNGDFGPDGDLEVILSMDAEEPTNPFKHRYHPDHNNRDEQWLNYQQEAYEITRRIQLVFSATDATGENPPGWGDTVMGGTYFEEITGVHRNPIFVSGTFRLQKVAATPVLNR